MKQKLLSLFVALVATTALWASNVITYTATEKLTRETLEVGATTFGSAITSHTYNDGTGTITCENEVTTIGRSAFYECTGLTSITIPNSVTTIGVSAFCYCTGLTSVIIPNSVTTIGEDAFYWCSGLTSLTIGNSVITLGESAFSNCSDLTSITIPNSVIKIGRVAFYHCFRLASITIGNSVTAIGESAFEGCSGLTSITIPNSVTTIGSSAFYECSKLTSVTLENYFTNYTSNSSYSNTFPSSTKIIYANPITASIVDKKICSVTISLSIPEIYNYDEIGLSDNNYTGYIGVQGPINYETTHFPVDNEGYINITNLPLNTTRKYYLYAKKGTKYIYNRDGIEVSTQTPSVSCSSSTTQTTITLSNIYASTDESVTSLTKGIYYNYKHYEADENNKVILTEIAPNKKCTLQVYGCYNGQYYYGDKKYITTQSINPTVTTSQETPTSIYARGAYTQGDATILSTTLRCNSIANVPQGEEGYFTGLRPKTKYTFTYEVNTKEGGAYSANKEFTTPDLTLTTLTPKVVSAGTAVVAAETNISDYETNVGFEWRKYDAPESMPSKSGAAIICNGVMEGRLLNLGTDAYWNVRPYYEAADGTRYYGEWITFDPSDFSYFEPTIHTYALTTSPTSNNVQVRGYVMTGTDEVTEQGFEYWANGAAAPQRVAATTSNDVQRVTATGQLMTAVLENLAYNTTYTCRAYALANGKTYYGEEIQFLTPENTTGLFDVFMNNSNAQKVTKYLHNGQLIIDRNGQHYSATGQKLR